MKNTIYYMIFKDIYSLMQSHFPPTSAQGFWDDLTEKAGELDAKYKGEKAYPFYRALCVNVVSELERIYKNEK